VNSDRRTASQATEPATGKLDLDHVAVRKPKELTMVGHADGTVVFFRAMAPVLIANVLTVTFVSCFA
jgi:hypothetical protein